MKKIILCILIISQIVACTTIDLKCPAVPSKDCQQWQQSDYTNAVKEWNSNGFTYVEARKWIDNDIDAKTAKKWLKSGFNATEAITYLSLNTDIKTAKRWKKSKYTLAEAKKYIKQGILTPKAVKQKKKVKYLRLCRRYLTCAKSN